jgi:hypothetical protein
MRIPSDVLATAKRPMRRLLGELVRSERSDPNTIPGARSMADVVRSQAIGNQSHQHAPRGFIGSASDHLDAMGRKS